MRLSLRARITVMFVATVLGVGLALIGLVYAYLKLTPVPVMASFPGADDGVVIDGTDLLHLPGAPLAPPARPPSTPG